MYLNAERELADISAGPKFITVQRVRGETSKTLAKE